MIGIDSNEHDDEEEAPLEEIDEFNVVEETNQEATTSSSGSSSDETSLLSDFIEIHEVPDETSLSHDETSMSDEDGENDDDDDIRVPPRLEVNEGPMEMIEMQDILHTET